jgi:hypothetical protein
MAKPIEQLDAITLNHVRESLIKAQANGFDFVGMYDDEVAGDIISFDQTFEGWEVEKLALYVCEVRESLSRRTTQ